jgi:mannose-1-phosphate guanylyltransferase
MPVRRPSGAQPDSPPPPATPPAPVAAPATAAAAVPATAIGHPTHDPGLPFDTDTLDAAGLTDALAMTTDAVGTLPAEQPQPVDDLDTGLALWAVILAGGIGSRFWPLSTPERPKQLLSLVGERPLISETVARLAPTVAPERVLVLTSADIADALRAAIPEVPDANMLVEPRPMGTAAALAWGATEVQRRAGPNAVVVAMHADLAVGFPHEFRRQLARAARLATGGEARLVMLGAEPTRNETGFGYAIPGEALDLDAGAAEVTNGARVAPRRVQRFVEKPGPLLAEQLIGQGAFWHTGIVVGTARAALEALAERTTELETGLAALAAGKMDRFAGLIQSVSVERGLLERMPDLVVLPCDFGWDDVGTWAALRRVRELDDTGNGVWGPAHVVDASSCVVHSEAQTVVVYGVSGMLVVSRPGLTFVTTLERATELNPLLDALPSELAGRARRGEIL